MDSVSEEYFYTVDLVKSELESFKIEQNDLKLQISKIFQENKRLTNELRENVLIRDHQLSEKGLHDLERKLTAANAAKETALAMWQEAMQQLEKQEELLVGKKSLVESERHAVDKSIEQIKEHYQKGIMTLSSELTSCRSDLLSTKQELITKISEFNRCKGALETTNEELSSVKLSLTEITSENVELSDKLRSFQISLADSENLLSTTKEQVDIVISKNTELSALVSDLKEQNKKLKHDVLLLEKDAKESLFAAQEAILQKKEMAYREEQYLKEIDILKSSTGIDVRKVELKCESKLKETQEQNIQKIQSLMDEIQLLHKENGEKQCLFEKVEREKKALESKLELLYSEISSHIPNGNTMFDDLCKRLTMAESSRDEFALKIKLLQGDLEELKSSKEQEVKGLVSEKKVLKERLLSLSKDCSQSMSDKIKLREELSVLKKKCHEMEKGSKLSKTKQTQVLSSLQAEAERKQQSLKEQLYLTEEHYKGVCSELQNLLESQFKISNKWKEETEELISKSESKIIELCDIIAHLQQQNNELVSTMQQNSSYKRIINAYSTNEN